MRSCSSGLIAALALAGGLLAGCSPPAGVTQSVSVGAGSCRASWRPVPVVALTASGAVEALDPTTVKVRFTVAEGAAGALGLALRPELDAAYVTERGPDGRPALWALPLARCRGAPAMVEPDAELPSVSPDGGVLGYVTLDPAGRQTGVAVVALGADGRPVGTVRRYPATATPPPLPIDGLAVGRDDAELAVWGGFVDPYLGPKRVTVGTLDPATASSLAALTPVFDAQGVSVPVVAGRAPPPPKDWQATPVYLPNGWLLVGDGSSTISLPFTDTTPGESGGGIRTIVRSVGPLASLAAGENGTVAFVGGGGRLTVALGAVDLPFGPGADTPPGAAAPEHTAAGRFTAVAWTEGPAAEHAALPGVFHIVDHMPDVVGMSASAATALLNRLDLPVLVVRTVPDSAVPAGVVAAQDPPAGDGVACQCDVTLTVSGGDGPG